ncbi:MAG: adenosylcobalamin-dependent ribonucleoside-diphosphate reductase [Actinobacteria bacterium]|nr:adenosylcobalamin-dependent ribonucleoside-diphosphate reductase [Actinomycetota bacterium]
MIDTPELTPNARAVLEARYLARSDGRISETPDALFRRVAENVAAPERRYGGGDADVTRVAETFRRLMAGLEFLPNSPTLMNAGRPLQQLAACFVLPVGDSIPEIFDAVKYAAIIHQSGGGTGFSFSRLRPAADVVHSTGGPASGPLSFMDVFNAATDAVKQGGTRRGANMGMLRVDHPDIEAFIAAKRDLARLTSFNVSVAVTDAFMQAVAARDAFALRHPRDGQVVRAVDAAALFAALVDAAWATGEPGLVFLDRINASNPTPAIGAIEATNPCGEQPLLPYEACNLGSINLTRMFGPGGVDYAKLGATVDAAVHFLDNVIDASAYPLPQVTAIVHANRKIGLGVMGFADVLFALGVPYDAPEARRLGGEIMRFVQARAVAASEALAVRRGAFPNFARSRYAAQGARPRRNATVTTVAPTGTLSIIAGCSAGIEPAFALAFKRRVLDGRELVETNPVFERVARARGFWSEALAQRVARTGHVADDPDVPEDARRVFVTALAIAPDDHVRMQAAFQAHTENAVSKTVNLPEDATRADVQRIFRLAYDLGCKGVTVYRYGSRPRQVLATVQDDEGQTRAQANGRWCSACAIPSDHTDHAP